MATSEICASVRLHFAEAAVRSYRLSERQCNPSFLRRTFSTSRDAIETSIHKQRRLMPSQRPFVHHTGARRTRFVRWNSPSPNPTPELGSPKPLSLSERMRKLSREYGWSALGVYLALSALDFPFCFLAVRLAGTDRIGYLEHLVVEGFWKVVEIPFPSARQMAQPAVEVAEQSALPTPEEREGVVDWGVEEAEKRNSGDNASLWTQLALAYAIHKSFIFIRVPLTAAVTPKVVKTLRSWGWNIGKRTPKPKPT